MNDNKLEGWWWLRVATLGLVAAFAGMGPVSAPPAAAADGRQQTFGSPEDAADALDRAVRTGEIESLLKILGPGSRKLVISGDAVADQDGRHRFAAAYDVMNKIVKQDENHATLVIGKDEWVFPIPIVKQDDVWRFDTKGGEQLILDRRIGRNELNTIQVCLAYVAAQQEYATKDRNGDGILEYAQKFVSTAGARDGLYWPTHRDETQSPLGLLVATARAEGYTVPGKGHKRTPYHGYYFKILKRQGRNALSGPRDYVVKGHMIGGFALIAFPAQYGSSGVMTFAVNQDGVVYQKDLGPETASVARRMTEFDPDTSWKTP